MKTTVDIDCPRGGYKFVVLSSGDEQVIFADDRPSVEFHQDLLTLYNFKSGKRLACLGGGNITFDAQRKVIRIYGKSVGFGMEPDRRATEKAVAAAYPDFSVAATVDEWGR